MKIRFKDEQAHQDFSNCRANVAIANYMGMDTHEAYNYCSGDIGLIDDNNCGITIPDPYISGFEGWNAVIHKGERRYFVIEGE
ncbi:hypothetical protein [Aeromonas phage AS-yj]|uniref:Uncharacterized protein n=4 Tax=Caudoviricetes TaxID=2731619 RepID=A0A411B7X7_9CAUD|nr:hypothetical protein HWB29_gp069 [Aeromonas phage AS-sw]ATI17813.1 hypothetical protein [Aeromonas phage AS-yj]QAX97726.1 hypothetical protein ASswx1_80 [Aeromonas phage Asswx_1]QAX98835.1 hypothetical protein assk_31 [Aeromonas phage Assk]UKM62762.1 hypothetical protein P19_0274 [Aeromonas phage P19]ATI18119.1 hypothetical protein [Aeromonas phage AS-sw]